MTTGVAADLNRAGDHTLDWLLEEAAAGEVFAAGHGERGNDLPVLVSSSAAARVDGGYRFTGHKIFGSLTPVWTRLGIHAMDLSDPAHPKVVHAFMPRDTAGYEIVETWDTLGMRATRSDDTIGPLGRIMAARGRAKLVAAKYRAVEGRQAPRAGDLEAGTDRAGPLCRAKTQPAQPLRSLAPVLGAM